jgi:phage internal scaffolding protein
MNEAKKTIRCRTLYDRVQTIHDCTGETRTVQYFKDECDVNKILQKYQKTGEIEHLNKRTGGYGDVSAVTCYQDAVDIIEKADEEFSQLPSQLRKQLENSPVKFLEWINDPENLDQMVELGLATKHPVSGNDDQNGQLDNPEKE